MSRTLAADDRHQSPLAISPSRRPILAPDFASFVFRTLLLLVATLALCALPAVVYAQNCGCNSSCACKGGTRLCGCGCSSYKIDKAGAEAQDLLQPAPVDREAALSSVGCVGGMAGPYPCQGVNLLSEVPLAAMGGGTANNGNAVWGWTSPTTGKDYAIVGRTNGTRFIDLSDPTNPIYLGNLPRTVGTDVTLWRDMKVYQNHAYIGADYTGSGSGSNHGMQVFDLTQLDAVDRVAAAVTPLTFAPNTTYSGFTKSHNIFINEDTGFAYAVGTNTHSGGLHFVDITNPISPQSRGGFSADGYTHDTQVVLYHGPDPAYAGREIAFNSNTDTLTIVDVTTKAAATMLSRTGYDQFGYTHQGWLTDDHRYFIMNDELDEVNNAAINRTRTHIWDVSDLDSPKYLGFEPLKSGSTDHNLFVANGLVYEANYTSGLRILDTRDVRNGDLYEIGWFDIVPASNSGGFSGAWSAYRFPGSGVTLVNGIEQGLFVLDTSGVVAGASTMGVMNGNFETAERGNVNVNIPAGQRALFNGNGGVPGTATINDLDIPGWIGSGNQAGLWHLTATDFPGTDGAAEGNMAMFLRSNLTPITVRQVLADVLGENTYYTLSIEVGQRVVDSLNAGYDIALYAGDSLLKRILDTDIGAPAIPVGSFTTVEFTIDSRDFASLIGRQLEIRLSTRILQDVPNTGFTFFDFLELDIDPIEDEEPPVLVTPEPATLGPLALALLLSATIRTRRGKRRRS